MKRIKKIIRGCLYTAAALLLTLILPGCGLLADYVEEQAFEYAPEEYCFRNSKLLEQHYEKHGIEMGFSSAEEYEAAASAVVTNPEALHKTEAEDGDDVYYIEDTNEFVVVSTDGYIRTYFLPDGGKAYFDRQ
jgi:pyocin large subunit-like protein